MPGKVACALALTDELEDLELAVAELLDGRVGAAGAPSRERVEQLGRHAFADIDLPVQHLPDAQQQFLRTRLLHDVTSRSGAEHALGVDQFVVHGDGEDGQAGVD